MMAHALALLGCSDIISNLFVFNYALLMTIIITQGSISGCNMISVMAVKSCCCPLYTDATLPIKTAKLHPKNVNFHLTLFRFKRNNRFPVKYADQSVFSTRSKNVRS